MTLYDELWEDNMKKELIELCLEASILGIFIGVFIFTVEAIKFVIVYA